MANQDLQSMVDNMIKNKAELNFNLAMLHYLMREYSANAETQKVSYYRQEATHHEFNKDKAVRLRKTMTDIMREIEQSNNIQKNE